MREPYRHRDVYAEARHLTAHDRRADYGDPRECHERIAQAWSAVLGVPVEARSVALCLAAVKLVRESIAHKRDNIVDGIAYIGIADQLSS